MGHRVLKYMKIITKKEILPIALIIITLLIGLQLYPKLPSEVPTHWNAQGQVDDFGSKNFAVFFFPVLALAIYLLMTFIPLIDPLKKRYKEFSLQYFWIKTIIIIFMLALYLFSLFAALGSKINIVYVIVPAISLMLILLGSFMPKIKKNYFVGVRTPWTLHSEEVWNKTHKFAGKSFIAIGTISLLGLLVKEYVFFIFIPVVILGSLAPVVYSYFVFKKIGGFKK